MKPLTRRSLLVGGAGAAGAAAVAAVGAVTRETTADKAKTSEETSPRTSPAAQPQSARSERIAFRSEHQAGINTPAQQHAAFAAFDVLERDQASVKNLLSSWTEVAETLTMGKRRPDDSGEATGLEPSRLTITFGFSASFFDDGCAPASSRPARLKDLPAFDGDAIEESWSGGDIMVQVCADDPTVVSHAVRQLRRVGVGTAKLRWMQNAFLPVTTGKTPRNLFGQLDGTANPTAGSAQFDKLVWADPSDSPSWMKGGTYMAVRRIRMSLTMWDRMSVDVHDATTGRSRLTGSPLSGGDEFTEPDFEKNDGDGNPFIAPDAHVRVAKMAGPGMFRRGYSFDNGPRLVDATTQTGSMMGAMDHSAHASHSMSGHAGMAAMMDDHDAGLMFVAFVADPQTQFVAVQEALSAMDALGHFLSYTSASLWAVPGGPMSGSIAEGLFS